MHTRNAIYKKSANTRMQNLNSDLSYLDVIARFDHLWQSTQSTKQTEKEMQRLIALIEHFESDQTNRTQHTIRENNPGSRSFKFTEADTYPQGES